jgi:hypothetical protein
MQDTIHANAKLCSCGHFYSNYSYTKVLQLQVLYRPLSIFEYFLNYQRLPKQETEVAYLSPSKSEENACNSSTVALARIESEDSESALGSNGIMTANLQAVEEIVKVREDANQPLKEDFEKSFEDDALGHLVVEKQEDRIQLSMQEYPNFSLWDAIQGLDFWYPTSSDPMKQHFQKVILKGK